jgi:hypothetical protein
VQAFRSRISSERGVFYQDFPNTDGFVGIVRNHLWSLVEHQRDREHWKLLTTAGENEEAGSPVSMHSETLSSVQQQTSPADRGMAAANSSSEDVGMLDSLLEAEELVQTGLRAITGIGKINAAMNAKLLRDADYINQALKDPRVNTRLVKNAVDATADDLNAYARELRPAILTFNSAITSAFGAFDTGIALWIKEGRPKPEQVMEMRVSLQKIVPSIEPGRDAVLHFRNLIASIPAATGRLAKARKLVKVQIDELLAGIAVALDRARSTVKRLDIDLGNSSAGS